MPVCSPALAAPFSRDPEQLFSFRMIRSVKAQIQWGHWFSQLGLDDSEVKNHLLFDRSHMAVDAAVLGMGVALESNLMMWQELKNGRLVVPPSAMHPKCRFRRNGWSARILICGADGYGVSSNGFRQRPQSGNRRAPRRTLQNYNVEKLQVSPEKLNCSSTSDRQSSVEGTAIRCSQQRNSGESPQADHTVAGGSAAKGLPSTLSVGSASSALPFHGDNGR